MNENQRQAYFKKFHSDLATKHGIPVTSVITIRQLFIGQKMTKKGIVGLLVDKRLKVTRTLLSKPQMTDEIHGLRKKNKRYSETIKIVETASPSAWDDITQLTPLDQKGDI